MIADEATRAVVERLRERGVVPRDAEVVVEPLLGGVSAQVLAVTAGDRRLVVKRALPTLRVAQEWHSSPARVLLEADALRCAGAIRPDNVPAVVDVDEQAVTIVLAAAPPTMLNWKTELLAGRIDPAVADELAIALADWHSTTSRDRAVLERFSTNNHFFELRISPFFFRVAAVHPDLEGRITEIVARMTARSECLVHGDFSPKNVLVGNGSLWVLDWETAHSGDPTFDLAFLVSHLACKAIHRSSDASRYEACAQRFVAAYRDRSALAIAHDALVAQAGCLVLARVDGVSPVDYFDDRDREVARALGRSVIADQRSRLVTLFGG